MSARVRHAHQVRAHRLHAAAAGAVAHELGVEAAGTRGRDAEHQVDDAPFAMALAIDALVAQHEPAVAGLALRECAAFLERQS